ncbi:hypothetical protein NMG60_11020562 [Bertholletia excelsa]
MDSCSRKRLIAVLLFVTAIFIQQLVLIHADQNARQLRGRRPIPSPPAPRSNIPTHFKSPPPKAPPPPRSNISIHRKSPPPKPTPCSPVPR